MIQGHLGYKPRTEGNHETQVPHLRSRTVLDFLHHGQNGDAAHVSLTEQNLERGLDVLTTQAQLIADNLYDSHTAGVHDEVVQRFRGNPAFLQKTFQGWLDPILDEGRDFRGQNDSQSLVAELKAHVIQRAGKEPGGAALHGR